MPKVGNVDENAGAILPEYAVLRQLAIGEAKMMKRKGNPYQLRVSGPRKVNLDSTLMGVSKYRPKLGYLTACDALDS